MNVKQLAKLAAGRCWAGYEPVPGKKPYSNDSCRPVGSKKKKKEEKKATVIRTLAKLAADPPCSCACGDTVSTCKCGPDCKCRKEGGSCYKGEKEAGIYGAGLKDKEDKQEKQAGKRGLWDNIHAKRKRGEKPAKPGEKDYPDSKSWTKTVKSSSVAELAIKAAAKSPAWQRSEGKNSEGGLNAKGRASYNKSTGGNLKAPVTQKNPKGKAKSRRASFCARMGGMKSKLTGEKTKNDPDSRINKALRKWNC